MGAVTFTVNEIHWFTKIGWNRKMLGVATSRKAAAAIVRQRLEMVEREGSIERRADEPWFFEVQEWPNNRPCKRPVRAALYDWYGKETNAVPTEARARQVAA